MKILKSQDSRVVFVLGVMMALFIIVLGYGVVTQGVMTLWEYTESVIAALAMFCVIIVAVIWIAKGD